MPKLNKREINSLIKKCKNKANVYKSRGKTISRHVIHTDNGIAVKMPNKDLSNSLIKELEKKE